MSEETSKIIFLCNKSSRHHTEAYEHLQSAEGYEAALLYQINKATALTLSEENALRELVDKLRYTSGCLSSVGLTDELEMAYQRYLYKKKK